MQTVRTCPLCLSGDWKLHMKASAWNNRHKIDLKKCKKCYFVYSNVCEYNYEHEGAHHAHTTRAELKEIARSQGITSLIDEILLKSGLNAGLNRDRVLDFGCGVGLSALCLKERGFDVWAVEASREYRKKLEEFEISVVDNLDLLALKGLQKYSFDLIIIKDVLEHVDNPMQTLKQILEYLKPGGYLYIRVPNVYHYRFHWSIDTKSHVNHFSPKHLKNLLRQNNLKKIDFIGVYDISTLVGKLYNFIFWKSRSFLPLYHQISVLYQKN